MKAFVFGALIMTGFVLADGETRGAVACLILVLAIVSFTMPKNR